MTQASEESAVKSPQKVGEILSKQYPGWSGPAFAESPNPDQAALAADVPLPSADAAAPESAEPPVVAQGPLSGPAVLEPSVPAVLADEHLQPGETGFRFIEIKLLEPSRTNPRKSFGKEGLNELAASLKSSGGMIEPLLVRPLVNSSRMGFWEIVAGERRYRAAKIARLDAVPCVVRELNDDQVLEIQIIENLQREDLSPIEEGNGYRTLMEKSGLDAEAIGKKIGKSRRYVYSRMKLCTLIPGVARLVTEGEISASHGELVGRLPEANQADLLKVYLRKDWQGSYPSIRELTRFIQENYYHQLDAVAFPKDDPLLVPAAGACTVCPKNTAVNPDLGTGKDGAVCTDAVCYEAKRIAFQVRLQAEAGKDVLLLSTSYTKPPGVKWIPQNEWTACKPKDCQYAAFGLVVHGDDRLGEKLTVCVDKRCKKHSGGDESEKWKVRQTAEKQKLEIEQKARTQYWLRLGEVLPEVPDETDWLVLARGIIERIGNDARRSACKALKLEIPKGRVGPDDSTPLVNYAKKAGKGIGRFLLLLMAAMDLVSAGYGKAERLTELGDRRKLDLGKMRELVLAERKDQELAKARKLKKTVAASPAKVQAPAPKKKAKKRKA